MISNNLLFAITLLTALGCGLTAGLFFIFSNTVMKALRRIEPSQGIAAMQSINGVILNPTFFVVFLGTAITCVLLLMSTLLGWIETGSIYLIFGCVAYLVGCILVTMLYNVPMNNALGMLASTDANSITEWNDYLTRWTLWNHVRTVSTIAATASFILALS